ncbi:MAG TPA: type II secretion system F family protein [Elusimicrobiota bacterium]|nr:type II secretion system F family protein [Elusimicrobiota bacterium]
MSPIDPSMHWLLFAVAFLGSAAAYTAVSRMFAPPPEADENDLSRLAKKEVGTSSAFSGLNPNGGLVDRLDLFLLKTFHLDVKLEELHMMLGRPQKPTPLDMLHLKEFFAAGAIAFLYFGTGDPVVSLFGLIGFFIPDSMFNGKVRARQADIMRNFPTMVDLMALTIEAGLDYMAAIERILKNTKQHGELEIELGKMINEVQLGYTRRDALKRLAMRTGVPEIRSFVGLIIQSDELGTSLVELLRNYAADMRFRRLNKAEKLAAQAATKMLIPLFIFIFPTVFIMMLAPMMKSLIQGGLGF